MVEQGSKPYLLIPSCCLPYALQTIDALLRRCVRYAADCKDVSLGRSPSLHGLRRRRLAGVVRPLRWYYEIVRLPRNVDIGRGACGLLRSSLAANGRGRPWGLPVLAHGASTHAQGLRLRGAGMPLALRDPRCSLPPVRTRSARRSGDFGAQWLACVVPCPRLTHCLTAL